MRASLLFPLRFVQRQKLGIGDSEYDRVAGDAGNEGRRGGTSDELGKQLASVYFDLPPLANELIPGVLRQGHKMRLTGPSKAGKSFALIDLAIAENPALAAIFAEKLQRAQRFNRTTRQPKEPQMNHTSAQVKTLQAEARLLRAWIREVTTPKCRRLIQITAEMNQLTGQRRIARPLEASAARRYAAKLLNENTAR